jgi:FAD/FMN-containing dehydrogenase
VIARGGGTSVAGNACGPGVVLDTSRHLGGVLDLDPVARLARVAPGTVLDDLQALAAPHGLRFGPDPSTHSRCTIGGMIGNNACGSHSVAWGRTVDVVRELDVLLYDGTRLTVGPTTSSEVDARAARPGTEGRVYSHLRSLVGTTSAAAQGAVDVAAASVGLRVGTLAAGERFRPGEGTRRQ